MAGIYGEFLGFYAELYEYFDVYKAKPDRVSGYELTYSRRIQGIRQSENKYINLDRYRRLPVMDFGQTWWLWTAENISLMDEFVKIDDRYYRPMTSSVFNREGGFWETKLEVVVGNDGTKNFAPELAQGTF